MCAAAYNVRRMCSPHLWISYFCCLILYKRRASAVTIVQYKTSPNVLDKKYPFDNHKKSLRVLLSYRTVTNPNGMFLCTLFEVKAGLNWSVFSSVFLSLELKPFSQICQEILCSSTTTTTKSICVSRAVHIIRTLLYEAWTFYIIPERTPPSSPWCLSTHSLIRHLAVLSEHFSIWEMKNK